MKFFKVKIITYILLFTLFWMFHLQTAISQNTNIEDTTFYLQKDELNHQNINIEGDNNKLKIYSASRTAKNVTDLPVTVYIISREEILRNGYVTLVDIMKSMPGCRVSQPYGETGESFSIRGLNGNNYVKILVNGIPVQPSVMSEYPILAQLPIRQAERIEVIYGPASSIYGADAAAGVINIVTKISEKGSIANADIVTGENGYNYINFMISNRAGKNKNILQYSLYGNFYEFRDLNINHSTSVFNPLIYLDEQMGQIFMSPEHELFYPSQVNEEVLTSWGVNPVTYKDSLFNPNYEGTYSKPEMSKLGQSSNMFGLQLKFRDLKFSFNRMYTKSHSSIGRTPFLFKYNDPGYFLGCYFYNSSLGYEKKFKKIFLNSTFSYVKYKMDVNSSYGITYVDKYKKAYLYEASDDLVFEQVVTYVPNKFLELTFGGTGQYSGNLPTINQQEKVFDDKLYKPFSTEKNFKDPYAGDFGYNPLVFNNVSWFAQAFITFKGASLMLSNRNDINSKYGKNHNLRYAFLLKLNKKMSLRFSESHAFKAPSSTKIYYSMASPNNLVGDTVFYAFLPNEKLEPENFVAHEFGYRYNAFKNVMLDVSVYYNVIKNMIYGSYADIDSTLFPNAVLPSMHDFSRPRIFTNSKDAESRLLGLQGSIWIKNIDPVLKLDADFHINYMLLGEETLPDAAKTQISTFRQMPKFIINANFSFEPFPNAYMVFENQYLSSWYRSFISNNEIYKKDNSKIKGYINTDIIIGYNISKQFRAYIKAINILNKEFAGIDGNGVDSNLPYNPQIKRNIRFGLSYNIDK